MKKYNEERDREFKIVKDTMKDIEEQSPGLVYGLPYFEKRFDSEMIRYDEKHAGLDTKLNEHIRDHKHQESLFWIKVGIVVAIVIPVIISLISLYYTFNPP